MDLIRCPRCAKEVPGSSQFCRRCGYTIAWNIATAPPVTPAAVPVARPASPQPRPARRTAPPTPSRPRKGGIVGVFAIVAAVFFFSLSTSVTRRVTAPSTPAVRFPTYNPPIFVEPAEEPTTIYPPTGDSRFHPMIRTTPIPQIIIPDPPHPWDASSRSRYTYPNPRQSEQHSSERSTRQR